MSTPTLYQSAPSPSMATTMANALLIQNAYADAYKRSANAANLAQLPIIGAAAGAGAILLHNHAHAVKTVGYIGIAASAYSAIQGIFFSNADAGLYLSGYSAMSCIRAEGFHFVGDASDLQYQLYLKDAAGLNQLVADDTVLEGGTALSGSATETQKKAFGSAIKLLSDSVTSANKVLQAANTNLGAYAGALSVFEPSIATVTTKVASKGRQGRALDYDSLKTSFSANLNAAKSPAAPNPAALIATFAPSAATGASTSSAPSGDDLLIQVVLDAAANLNANVVSMSLHAFDYSASLARVSACPNSI